MKKTVFTFAMLSISAPLSAHEGMLSTGAIHNLLHAAGNNLILTIAACLTACVSMFVALRLTGKKVSP